MIGRWFWFRFRASLLAQMVRNLPAMQETWVLPWVGKMPRSRKWLPAPVFLSAESFGQRNLEDYSPWGRKESDMAEQLILLGFVLAIESSLGFWLCDLKKSQLHVYELLFFFFVCIYDLKIFLRSTWFCAHIVTLTN